LPEKVCRQAEAGRNDGPTHQAARQVAGAARTQVTADDGGKRHEGGISPVDTAAGHKDDNRDAVDKSREQRLECIHLMYIPKAHHGKRAEHQNANAGAEIAAVHAYEKLKHDDRRAVTARAENW